MKRFFILTVLCCGSLELKPVSPGEQIRDLRAAQRYASLSAYDDIECQIAEIRDHKSTNLRCTPAMSGSNRPQVSRP